MLKNVRSVVVSLRLLPKLLQSFQQFRSSAEIQHTTMWAEQEHHMMPHFFANLMLFTENGPRHPNLFPQLIEVQVRLNFLTSVYSAPITPESFRFVLKNHPKCK
jgi:ubiquitin carboxyl-terminal hydrolase 34